MDGWKDEWMDDRMEGRAEVRVDVGMKLDLWKTMRRQQVNVDECVECMECTELHLMHRMHGIAQESLRETSGTNYKQVRRIGIDVFSWKHQFLSGPQII